MGNKSNNQGLGVAKLALFSIGLTLASGVFSLSGDFAAGRGTYTGGSAGMGNLRCRYVGTDDVFLQAECGKNRFDQRDLQLCKRRIWRVRRF